MPRLIDREASLSRRSAHVLEPLGIGQTFGKRLIDECRHRVVVVVLIQLRPVGSAVKLTLVLGHTIFRSGQPGVAEMRGKYPTSDIGK